jgi:hypothetical protein
MARFVSRYGEPWFWWEQDGVPVKPGWLDTIKKAHYDSGKDFLACRKNNYTCGLMVYPSNICTKCQPAILAFSKSWDATIWDTVESKIALTDLIQSGGRTSPTLFEKLNDLYFGVDEKTVVYHSCKDGSLHNILRNRPSHEVCKGYISNTGFYGLSDLTVVITNFKRPRHVKFAFESCLSAGIQNIVISSSGCDDDLKSVHARFKQIRPNLVIDAISADNGCNEMWLRGLKLVKTKWVHILHDDDRLLPNFREIGKALTANVGFVLFSGGLLDLKSNKYMGTVKILKGLKDGIYHSQMVINHLLQENTFTISPVQGVFQTRDIVATLEECSGISHQFILRPGMMVGNDSLIWLRAAEKHQEFFFLNSELIQFGSWDESTTYDDLTNNRGQLLPIYNRMKHYFRSNIKIYRPSIIHCVERHEERDPKSAIRKAAAFDSCNKLYANGVIPCHYANYRRDSSVIGDNRKLPFLKDILRNGLSIANDLDIILFTNDDIIIHSKLPQKLIEILGKRPVVMSHRCGCRNVTEKDYAPDADLFTWAYDAGGRDLFAFRASWLREHIDEIPDYLVGAPWFDTMLCVMIRRELNINGDCYNQQSNEWEGELPVGYIGHISHRSEWWLRENGANQQANEWNKRLAKVHLRRIEPEKTLDQVQPT